MTKITRNDVIKLASLARLSLTDDEIDKYTEEIASIFHYIDKLQSVDTEGIEPTYQVTGLSSVVRSDEVMDYGATQSLLLKNAPNTEDNLFKVKRMVG
jgi:aspartyl-tRNA(Asn)/glutamyl-tRNA(Gln) amidotransferase subunit C